MHYPEVDAIEHHPTPQQQSEIKHSRLEGIQSASRVASSIKAQEEDVHIDDDLGDNLLKDIQSKQEINEKTKQPEEEVPQKIP